jgi:alanyl aminopeptidase
MRAAALALAVVAGTIAATASADVPPGYGSRTYPRLRLPETARPTRYAAELTVVPTAATFAGAIDIDLALAEPTALVWLHGHALSIKQASFVQGGRTFPARVALDETDFLGLATDDKLAAGPAHLRIVYEGKIAADGTVGLFAQTQAGETYAFTQFESVYARRAFPCFDEPSFKVPWQLKVHVKSDHVVVSNTPIQGQVDEPNGMKLVTFAETAPLPSYLVALAVGPFERVDAGKAGRNGVPVGIIVPKGRAREAEFAARMLPQVLQRLEDYFDVPFGYPKLDLVSVPNFPGAMENAGMITSGETFVLSRRGGAVGFQRDFVALMLHETGHQWFGDLVTTAWWDDTWLNESFADWIEARVNVDWHPEWRTEALGQQSRPRATREDTLASARRIREPIATAADIANAFDDITYIKGSAVLGMFEAWLGRDAFRAGVSSYLRLHSNGNGTAAAFFDAIGRAAGRDVATPLATFLDQIGVPKVSVSLACEAGKPPAIALRQERLTRIGVPPGDGVWHIPVCVRYGGGGTSGRACTLLADKTGRLELGGAACPEWVFGNAGGQGYYIVDHEGGLADALARAPLTTTEKMNLMNDARVLAPLGRLGAAAAFASIVRGAADADPIVGRGAVALANELWASTILTDDLRPRYARFLARTLGPKARALGFARHTGEDEDTALLRPEIIRLAGGRGDEPGLLRQAGALARRWLRDPGAAKIDPDMIETVLAVAGHGGDAALFDAGIAALAKASDALTRQRLLTMLGSFRTPALIERALAFALDPRLHGFEPAYLLFPLSDSFPARAALTRFIDVHWDVLVKRFEGDFAGGMFYSFADWCDEARAAELERTFGARAESVPGGARTLAQIMERVRGCAAVQPHQAASAAAFLAKY